MDKNIVKAIEKLKQIFPEARFIVFGSQATGNASTDSDLDLCAVFPSLSKDPFDLIYDIRVEARKHLSMAMDIFVLSEPDYVSRSHGNGSLEHIIAAEGIAV
ncbi:nucleotidyltransferase domain-containing protein [Sediminispirochaeta smaragdinae]|uniref:DNA polymerase beta domain protein region n=1 Tax=Sediminispirochaeta smaragdinae (strain DSM 11293 / JCM 15392 / SEBR 4228) TaxID=573413 RepID=E1RAU1_SEDSS|nr:nucleotidyltransferase domain-containing protein [Sediminispirochaeta smaragdinae]ADK82459.1 DNA polymerase beta domain protein region [Sediminispirochaeta smaragdinae DSM 11293]